MIPGKMTLVPTPLIEKYCMVYCGPERCNCIRGNYQFKHINNKTIQDRIVEQSPDSDNDSTSVS